MEERLAQDFPSLLPWRQGVFHQCLPFSGYLRARESDGEVCCSVTPSAALRPHAHPSGMGGLRVASVWLGCIRAGREHELCKVLCKQPSRAGWFCSKPRLAVPRPPVSPPHRHPILIPIPNLILVTILTSIAVPNLNRVPNPVQPGCTRFCPLPAHPHNQARAADPCPQDPEVNMEITNRLFLPAVAVSHQVP